MNKPKLSGNRDPCKIFRGKHTSHLKLTSGELNLTGLYVQTDVLEQTRDGQGLNCKTDMAKVLFVQVALDKRVGGTLHYLSRPR